MKRIILIENYKGHDLGPQIISVLKVVKSIDDSEKEIVLDFSNYSWSPPVLSVLLSCIIDSNKIEFEGIKNINNLKTIFFPGGLECTTFEDIEARLSIYSNKSYLPIVKFSTSTISEVAKISSEIIGQVAKMIKQIANLPINYYSAINYILSEITDNIIEHSKTNYGWISFQYYKENGFIDVCIADAGRGLLKSYLEYDGNKEYGHVVTDRLAMIEATNGSSTKNLKERGFGLPTSRKMIINGLKGKYIYCSGTSLLNNDDVMTIPDNYYYNGTFVILRIPCNQPIQSFNYIDYIEC